MTLEQIIFMVVARAGTCMDKTDRELYTEILKFLYELRELEK